MQKWIINFWREKLGISYIDNQLYYMQKTNSDFKNELKEKISKLETDIAKLKIENECYQQIFSSIVHFEKKL